MAESLGDLGVVYVRVMCDSSQAVAGMANLRTSAQSMAAGLTTTVGRLTGIGIGLFAVKRGIDAVVKSFVEFDTQMHYIWTLTDKTESQMATLSNELRSVALQYNATATEAARALYEIYSATFEGADAMKILQASLKGAAAGLSDVLTAVDITTTVLNAYRMSADKATYVNDVLFQTVKYGKVVYSELANQFGRLAGISAPAGVAFEDMAAGIMTLTRQGITADWAVTALRQTIMQILRPGAELRDIIEGLGYETGRALFSANGFAGSLKMIADAAEANGTYLENLFSNVRAVTAVMPLASTSADEYAKDLVRAANATGEMGRAFDKVKDSWQYMLKVITTSMKDSAISMGKVFMPALAGLLQAVNLLLKPLALLAEGLNAIGGGYALGAVAILGAMYAAISLLHLGYTKMIGALAKAGMALQAWSGAAAQATVTSGALATSIAGLNAQWYTSSTAAGVAATSQGVAGGGMAAAIGKLSPLKMLGAGAAAFMGAGAMMKGLVNLDLAISGKVSGAEKARAEIEGSLETALGPIIGGAVIGTMFAPGVGTAVGAGIGLAIAAASTLVIWVKHTVEKGAADYTSLKGEAMKIARSVTLPSETTPSVTGATELDALVERIIAMSPALQAAGQEGVNAAESVVQSLYDTVQTGWGEFKRVLVEDLAQIQAIARAAGIEMSQDDIIRLIQAWRDSIKKDIPDGLSGISEYIKSQLPENIKDALDALDSTLTGKLDAEGFASFMSSFTEQIQEFVSTVTGGVSNRDIQASADLWKEYMASLSGMGSTEDLARAQARISGWFSLITKGISDEGMAAFVIRLHEAGVSFEGLSEIMGILGVDTEALKKILYGLWEETKVAATETIPTTSAQIQKARGDFMDIYQELKAGDITLAEAGGKFKELKDMASLWADYAEMAKKAGWDSADSVQFLADTMDALIGDAEDAASAVDLFAKALQDVALVAGASMQIQGIFADMQKLLTGATTLGEAAQIMGALQSGQGTAESFKEGLERIFAPDSSYATESKEWARKTWSQIGDQFPKLGSTLADLTDQARKLAETQKKAAEEAAQAAKKAAEEAYKAEQEAFREQFIRPTLDAIATGDFGGAADKINALRDNFAGLVNQGAQLGMSATDILGMMQSARSELLSSIDGYIAISNATPELVEALQSAKKQIEEMWGEAKTAQQKALDEINLSALVEDPERAATALRALAQEFDDAKGVSKYTNDLVTQLQEEIAARGKLGYDTGLLDDALLRFNSALMGTLAPFERFMGAINQFSSGIIELADAIIPGFGGILSKVFDVGNAIATTGGISWAKGKPVAMAEGGIATEPTFALIGEAGPEAVIPLSGLADMPGFGSASDSSPFTVPGFAPEQTSAFPALSAEAPFTIDQSLLDGTIDDFTAQIEAFGLRVLTAAALLVSAIEASASMLALTNTFTPQPASIFPDTPTIQSELDIEKGFAPQEKPLGLDLPTLEAAMFDITGSLADGVTSMIDTLEAGIAQLTALPPPPPISSALQQIPEIPAFDSTPDAVEPFTPDVIAQALAKALTAADITPGKAGEEKKFSSPLLDLIAKLGPVVNSAISLGVSIGKAVVDFAKGVIADFEAAAREAADALGEVLTSAVDNLVSSVTSLADKMQGLITSTETYSRLQSAISGLQSKIFNTLMGWAWPLIAIFEKLTGAVEETANSLNVPTGYKVTRNEWAAARPGEPGEKRGSAGELPEWMNDILLQFKDAIQGVVDTFTAFFDLMSGVWEALAPIVMEGILPALQSFANGLLEIGQKIKDELLPVLQETLAGTIAGFLGFFSGAILGAMTFFTDTLIAIMPNLELFAQSMGALGATLPGLAASLSDALSPAINTLLEGLTLLAGWVTVTMIPGLQTALAEFGALWTSNIGPFFTESVFPKILEWATTIYDFVMKSIIPAFTGTVLPFLEHEAWPTLTKTIDEIILVFKGLWDTISDNAGPILDMIKGLIEDWGEKIKAGATLLTAKTLYDAGELGAALKTIWESNSLSIWQQVGTSFAIAFGEIGKAIGNIWEAAKPVIEPLLVLIGGTLMASLLILGAAFDALAFAIRLITWPVEVLYTMLYNLGVAVHNVIEWIKHPLNPDERDNWEYKDMPAFASGGVVTSPTLAMIGEKGPEAIVPLSGGLTLPGLSGGALAASGGLSFAQPTEAYARSSVGLAGSGLASSDGTVLVQTRNVIQMNGRTLQSELNNTRRQMNKLSSANGRAWSTA